MRQNSFERVYFRLVLLKINESDRFKNYTYLLYYDPPFFGASSSLDKNNIDWAYKDFLRLVRSVLVITTTLNHTPSNSRQKPSSTPSDSSLVQSHKNLILDMKTRTKM